MGQATRPWPRCASDGSCPRQPVGPLGLESTPLLCAQVLEDMLGSPPLYYRCSASIPMLLHLVQGTAKYKGLIHALTGSVSPSGRGAVFLRQPTCNSIWASR